MPEDGRQELEPKVICLGIAYALTFVVLIVLAAS